MTDQEDKKWSWEYLSGDRVRAGMDIQILTRKYHTMRVIDNDLYITLRVKEHGFQDVTEVDIHADTIVRYKKADMDLSFMDNWMTSEDR